jgi:hypothetical protein
VSPVSRWYYEPVENANQRLHARTSYKTMYKLQILI